MAAHNENSPVAQLVERLAVNQWVAGSSPAGGAFVTVDAPAPMICVVDEPPAPKGKAYLI